MNNLPSLRAIQVFEAVGRYGGIVEAARRLGISAGAVSQQMKLLEDSLGLSLTFRVGKRIGLTDSGAAVSRQLRGGVRNPAHRPGRSRARQEHP
ncbi:helix-turn-helix domain-containing protein [Pseudomonas fluorescens]|uniref:helix-turn-helix domain-containing protein n=1 Tax=Pseudomonas fluorescens TaxID=294 RepID=UPI003F96F37F